MVMTRNRIAMSGGNTLIWLACCVATTSGLVAPPRRPARAIRLFSDAIVGDLVARIDELTARLGAVEDEVATLRRQRLDALEAEAAALRGAAAPAPAPAAAGGAFAGGRLQAAMAARAALGAAAGTPPATSRAAQSQATTYDADEVEALGGEAFFFEKDDAPKKSKNDAFLDDDLEELLELGGDPTFLDAARGAPPKKDGEWEWDGIEDETAYFDDDF